MYSVTDRRPCELPRSSFLDSFRFADDMESGDWSTLRRCSGTYFVFGRRLLLSSGIGFRARSRASRTTAA
jgi:hypothetical protein